jgi:hypothetical protein
MISNGSHFCFVFVENQQEQESHQLQKQTYQSETFKVFITILKRAYQYK